MDQEWFVYTFVARGTVILVEHTTYASNLLSIAAQTLRSIPPSHTKFTMNRDHHTFNFLVEDGYVYGVVAKESVGSQILFEFLERVKEELGKRYDLCKGDATIDKSLNKAFGPMVKEHMKYVSEHAQEIEKLTEVKAKISEVQIIILDNIGKIRDRGEQINSVADKAEELHNLSQQYKANANAIRQKMWYQNMKIKLAILAIFLVLGFIIWISICHGFSCVK